MRPKKKRNVRTSSRSSGAKSSRSKKRAPSSGLDRGSAGFAKAAHKREKQEADFQKRRETPWDFRLKPGEDAEIVVLDRGEPFFVNLHTFKTPQGRYEDEVCIADSGERCPLCKHTDKDGAYMMILTVLDRRQYKVQKGPNKGKVIKATKRLLKVKQRNLPKFERQWKRKYSKSPEGFRGLRINCARSGDKEMAMGEDLEFLGVVSDAKLKRYKELSEPANYEKIFAPITAQEMIDRYNLDGTGVAGSEEFDSDGDDYDLDDVGWDE